MAKGKVTDESALIGALDHPLRRQILRRMRNIDAISPRQLSMEFEHPVSNVAYHVRVLADCDAITLVRVRPVRGVVEHFYRNSLRPPWARQIIDLESPATGA